MAKSQPINQKISKKNKMFFYILSEGFDISFWKISVLTNHISLSFIILPWKCYVEKRKMFKIYQKDGKETLKTLLYP